MTTHVVPLSDGSEYDFTHYGILFRSTFVYETNGSAFPNSSFPHRFTVWNNSVRPNEGPLYGPDAKGPMGVGKIGPGAYVDPHRKGTDELYSYLIGSESTVITNNGTNTGTAASGQVWCPTLEGGHAFLAEGDVIIFSYPRGGLSEPFKLSSTPYSGPMLTRMV